MSFGASHHPWSPDLLALHSLDPVYSLLRPVSQGVPIWPHPPVHLPGPTELQPISPLISLSSLVCWLHCSVPVCSLLSSFPSSWASMDQVLNLCHAKAIHFLTVWSFCLCLGCWAVLQKIIQLGWLVPVCMNSGIAQHWVVVAPCYSGCCHSNCA